MRLPRLVTTLRGDDRAQFHANLGAASLPAVAVRGGPLIAAHRAAPDAEGLAQGAGPVRGARAGHRTRAVAQAAGGDGGQPVRRPARGWFDRALPDLHLATLRALVASTFTIALLGGIESLRSVVVADGMIGGRHRLKMDLVAQGNANIASPLVGGIPATGSIARTATCARNARRTPVAGIIQAVAMATTAVASGGPPIAHRRTPARAPLGGAHGSGARYGVVVPPTSPGNGVATSTAVTITSTSMAESSSAAERRRRAVATGSPSVGRTRCQL